jgi:hypothetical protein
MTSSGSVVVGRSETTLNDKRRRLGMQIAFSVLARLDMLNLVVVFT